MVVVVVVGLGVGLQLFAVTPAARVATTAMDFVEGILTIPQKIKKIEKQKKRG